jgi:epoxyqueuosine reductase QueG
MTISASDIKTSARAKGADLVGIASAEAFAKYPEERRPQKLLANAKSVIVVGVRVLADTVKPNLLLSPHHAQPVIGRRGFPASPLRGEAQTSR